MRYAIFSDIHGNAEALKAMLSQAEVQMAEGYIFCGDILGYFYGQSNIIRTFKRLYPFYAVLGNHDYNYLKGLDEPGLSEEFSRCYGKSYLSPLSPNDISFLQNLPGKIELDVSGEKVLIIHGSISDPINGRVYPDTKVSNITLYDKYNIIFCGHTHYRMKKIVGNTILVNPGSLGQPRDGNGFGYCIFDFDNMTPEFYSIALDKQQIISDMECKGENEELISYIGRTFERNN